MDSGPTLNVGEFRKLIEGMGDDAEIAIVFVNDPRPYPVFRAEKNDLGGVDIVIPFFGEEDEEEWDEDEEEWDEVEQGVFCQIVDGVPCLENPEFIFIKGEDEEVKEAREQDFRRRHGCLGSNL